MLSEVPLWRATEGSAIRGLGSPWLPRAVTVGASGTPGSLGMYQADPPIIIIMIIIIIIII
jgi:hypothetical protein